MSHAWLDVSAGVAGDMLLGACVDAGADLGAIEAVVRRVVGPSVALRGDEVTRGGQRATRVVVEVHNGPTAGAVPARTWHSIRDEIAAADLPPRTRDLALGTFRVLAEAEGRVHGVDPETIHFHEAGALDSIADVVGTCEGLRLLGVTSVTASAVALGEGRIRAAHGDIPVPVPAVAQLALGWQVAAVPGARGDDAPHHDAAPHQHATPHRHEHEPHGPDGHSHTHGETSHEGPAVVTSGGIGELATPTGMALVRSLATACEPLPAMTLRAVGVGAGSRDLPGHPNTVRVLLGTPAATATPGGPAGTDAVDSAGGATREHGGNTLLEVCANVDDMDPRLWPGVLAAVLDAGAVDVWLTPILMKKGRPAHCLHALAAHGVAENVADAMLRLTSTLGVRSTPVGRWVLERGFGTVSVDGHPVEFKVGHRDGVVVHAAAEFADVQRLAARFGEPELDVLARTNAALVAAGLVAGADVPATLVAERGAP